MKYLVVYPCNGLCNRLRAIASGYILAQQLGRQFLLCWEPTPDIGTASFTDLFESQPYLVDSDTVTAMCASTDFKSYVCGRQTESAVLADVCKDTSSIIVIRKSGGNYHHPSMSTGKFNSMKSTFYKSLTPVGELQDIISRYSDMVPKGSIGVHVRRTDRSCFTPATSVFVSKIKQLMGKTPVTTVFICSDDNQEIANIANGIGSLVKTVTYDKRKFARDDVDSVKEAVIEWSILAHCTSIVFSHSSSFGYEACIVNRVSKLNAHELRSDSKRTENEKRNLPLLIYDD